MGSPTRKVFNLRGIKGTMSVMNGSLHMVIPACLACSRHLRGFALRDLIQTQETVDQYPSPSSRTFPLNIRKR